MSLFGQIICMLWEFPSPTTPSSNAYWSIYPLMKCSHSLMNPLLLSKLTGMYSIPYYWSGNLDAKMPWPAVACPVFTLYLTNYSGQRYMFVTQTSIMKDTNIGQIWLFLKWNSIFNMVRQGQRSDFELKNIQCFTYMNELRGGGGVYCT